MAEPDLIQSERLRCGESCDFPIAAERIFVLDDFPELLHLDLTNETAQLFVIRSGSQQNVYTVPLALTVNEWHCDGKALFLLDRSFLQGVMVSHAHGMFTYELVALPSNAFSFLRSNLSIYYVIECDNDFLLIPSGSTQPSLKFSKCIDNGNATIAHNCFIGGSFVVHYVSRTTTTVVIHTMKNNAFEFNRSISVPRFAGKFTQLKDRYIFAIESFQITIVDCLTMEVVTLPFPLEFNKHVWSSAARVTGNLVTLYTSTFLSSSHCWIYKTSFPFAIFSAEEEQLYSDVVDDTCCEQEMVTYASIESSLPSEATYSTSTDQEPCEPWMGDPDCFPFALFSAEEEQFYSDVVDDTCCEQEMVTDTSIESSLPSEATYSTSTDQEPCEPWKGDPDCSLSTEQEPAELPEDEQNTADLVQVRAVLERERVDAEEAMAKTKARLASVQEKIASLSLK